MKFLVVGNATQETVRRDHDGRTRHHTGGVGAIMARELALAGADVTFLTTAPPGQATKRIENALESLGAACRIVPGDPPQSQESRVTIHVRDGQPVRANGKWGRMGGLKAPIREMAPDFDWILTSLNPSMPDLHTLLEHGKRIVTNATTNRLAPRMLELKGQCAATMNHRESGHIMAAIGRGNPDDMPEHIGAKLVLLTKGSRGMEILRPGQKPHRSPAPTPPRDTDFIGAGDAATAGLAYALAHRLELTSTIGTFVTSLMQRNAEAYR